MHPAESRSSLWKCSSGSEETSEGTGSEGTGSFPTSKFPLDEPLGAETT